MKIKVPILVAMAIWGSTSLKAQLNVGASTAPAASAMLQVSGTTLGFLPPVLTSTQRNAIATPAVGLVIFNSTTDEIEVNTGSTAVPVWTATTGSSTILISQPIDASKLGYVPSTGTTAATAAASFISNSVTYTKTGAFTSTINNHSYAFYKGSAAMTFSNAYIAVQTQGGYLATFTSFAEWNSVLSGLLTPNTSVISTTAWIGMAKLSWRAGIASPTDAIDWITGEHSSLDYSGGGTDNIWVYNNFITNLPDATNGFITIVNGSTGKYSTGAGAVGTNYGWSSISSTATSPGFIVEFNQ